jgi:hypothetical protein
LNRQFSEEEVKMTNKYMKKYSTSLAIKEVQIKTTLKFHLTQSEWQSSRKQTITNAGEGSVGKRNSQPLLVGM